MKGILAAVLFLASAPAFAGWGAIACNLQDAQCRASQGYTFYSDAVNNALAACGPGCQLMNWENNECIAVAIGGGTFGRAQGFFDSYSADQAAVNACGNPECVVIRTACN